MVVEAAFLQVYLKSHFNSIEKEKRTLYTDKSKQRLHLRPVLNNPAHNSKSTMSSERRPEFSGRTEGGAVTRRSLLLPLLLSPFVARSRKALANTPSSDDLPWKRLFTELAVGGGAYAGAYRVTPNGAINWYFANVGLQFIVNTLPDAVRNYLDAYIRAKDPVHHDISDIGPDLVSRVAPDSHDAYAGTFLGLAARYLRSSGDSAWWQANLSQLKAVAYYNLLTQIKPNGLVRAFQAPHPNGIGYLMDQCEAYQGLRDFGEALNLTNDPDAGYFSGFAVNLGIAVHRLFDPSRALWLWSDASPGGCDNWYPEMVAQIYPHLCDVHSSDAPGDYYRMQRGYEILRQTVPDWWNRPQDLYPWLAVGYYAALRQNNTNEAMAMLAMAQRFYLPGGVNTGHFAVCDLGYACGILAIDSQRPASSSCFIG
jgi:hypothetical protein